MCAGGVILTLSFVGFFSCTDRVHLLGQVLSWLLSAPAAPQCQLKTFATTATAAPPAAGHPQTAPRAWLAPRKRSPTHRALPVRRGLLLRNRLSFGSSGLATSTRSSAPSAPPHRSFVRMAKLRWRCYCLAGLHARRRLVVSVRCACVTIAPACSFLDVQGRPLVSGVG
jgi:hypothetical protein